MSVPSITQIVSALPTPPTKLADNFDALADAFVAAFPQMRTEINSLVQQLNATTAGINTGITDALVGATYRQAFLSYLRDTTGQWATDVQPTLNLFCGAMIDDSVPLGTFTRSAAKTRRGPTGRLESVAAGLLSRDWGADGALLGWLLEAARTNYCIGSATGSISAWGSDGMSLLAGYNAPDGTTNAVKLLATGSIALAYTMVDVPYYATTDDYYPMIFLKRGNQRYATLNCFYNSLAETNAYVDFDNKIITNEAYPGDFRIDQWFDDWYRVGFRILRNGTGAIQPVSFRIWPNMRDSVVTGDYCYAFGPSIEYGPFPTSFIYPGASAVTRPADIWTIPTSEFAFNDRAGALFFSGDMLHYDDMAPQYLASVAGSATPLLLRRSYTDNFIKFCDAESSVLPTAGTRLRVIGSYNADGTTCVVNGGSVGSAGGIAPTGSSIVTVGNYGGSEAVLNGHLYQLSYFAQPVDGGVATL